MDISNMLNPDSRADISSQHSSILSKPHNSSGEMTPRMLNDHSIAQKQPSKMNHPAAEITYDYELSSQIQPTRSTSTITPSGASYNMPSNTHPRNGREYAVTNHADHRQFDTSANYDHQRPTNFNRPPSVATQPPMAAMERNYSSGYHQEMYSPQMNKGTGQLDALAAIASSRYSQDLGRERTAHSTISRKYDDSTRHAASPRGNFRHEPYPRRESHPVSPRGAAPEHEFYSGLHRPSGSRTVSVGSQTSRPNSPDQPTKAVQASKPNLPSINTNIGKPSGLDMSPLSASPGNGAESPLYEDDDHKCSYTDSCETGSPLRKVVSHFFGRNKLATRKIPKHLWVYFCRKHYQRSRYRNPRGFATLQIQLVETQINNLKNWGGVIDWTVKVRRREEMRTKPGNASSPIIDDGDDDGEQGMRQVQRRGSGTSGSILNRYMDYVGEKRTMDEVITLVGAIKDDMKINNTSFPDLELLPNVATGALNGDGPSEKSKGRQPRASKAKPATITRKRKTTDDGSATVPIVPYTGQPSAFGYNTTGAPNGTRSRVPTLQPASRRPSHQTQSQESVTANSTQMFEPRRSTDETSVYSSKRPRLSCQTSDISRKDSTTTTLSQTVTPPLSAPGISRRTSSSDSVQVLTGVNNLPLDRVDAALHTHRSQETFNSDSTRKSNEQFTAINANATAYGA